MSKLKEYRNYRVTVRTCNAAGNYFKATGSSSDYHDCDNYGTVHVTTNNPEKIFEIFGDVVLKIELLGIAYVME